MTRIYAFLTALALAGLLSSCGITGPVPPPGTPGITNCSDTALHQAELGIVGDVESALAQGNYSGAEAALTSILLNLTASVGAPLALAELNCVVAWVEAEATKASIATADSVEATKASNAVTWLQKHPANVTGSVSP